jgi:hypothetical protein
MEVYLENSPSSLFVYFFLLLGNKCIVEIPDIISGIENIILKLMWKVLKVILSTSV